MPSFLIIKQTHLPYQANDETVGLVVDGAISGTVNTEYIVSPRLIIYVLSIYLEIRV